MNKFGKFLFCLILLKSGTFMGFVQKSGEKVSFFKKNRQNRSFLEKIFRKPGVLNSLGRFSLISTFYCVGIIIQRIRSNLWKFDETLTSMLIEELRPNKKMLLPLFISVFYEGVGYIVNKIYEKEQLQDAIYKNEKLKEEILKLLLYYSEIQNDYSKIQLVKLRKEKGEALSSLIKKFLYDNSIGCCDETLKYVVLEIILDFQDLSKKKTSKLVPVPGSKSEEDTNINQICL